MFKCAVLICFAVLALHSSPTSGALTLSRRFAQPDNEDNAVAVPASNKLDAIEDGPIEEEEEDNNELEDEADQEDSDLENAGEEESESEDAGEENSESEDAEETESESEDAGEENSESEDAEETESESENAGEEESESEDAAEESSDSEDSDEKDDDDDEDIEYEEFRGLKGEELSKKLSETFDIIGESLLETSDESYKPLLEKVLKENADRKWTSVDEFVAFWLTTYLEVEELHNNAEETK